MNETVKSFRECWKTDTWLKILTIASILLIVVSFFLPPTGVIDPSVFAGTGEMFAFGALWEFNRAMDKNIGMKIKVKETELEILKTKKLMKEYGEENKQTDGDSE